MALWGNLDFANNRPHMPLAREVVPVATGTTANNTAGGSRVLIFTANLSSAIQPGCHVYGEDDVNGRVSKVAKDASNFDQSDIAWWRSNNTVASVNTVSNLVVLNNIITGAGVANNSLAFPAGKLVYFANTILHDSTTTYANYANDTILVTGSRMSNTQGTVYGYGSTVANTKIGSVNQGWNKITRKINSDGAIRFLKETIVCLANPIASNIQSGNTSSNAVFGGL
jgi:hypothetical protein